MYSAMDMTRKNTVACLSREWLFQGIACIDPYDKNARSKFYNFLLGESMVRSNAIL